MRCALEVAIVGVSSSMNAQAVANILWALAMLGWQPGEEAMRGALEGAAVRISSKMNSLDVANTLWALAALGWQASAELADLVRSLVSDGKVVRLSARELSQLLMAHCASQFLCLGSIVLPPAVHQMALDAFKEAASKATVSTGQREVGESLRRLRMSHELEHSTAGGLFRIDLAIVDQRIAIEFDGPSHFTTNTLEPLGHTRLRDRLLSAMGWRVVSIPFFEWDRRHETEQKDAYVEQKVRLALAQRPSN